MIKLRADVLNITDKLVVRKSQPKSEDDGADEPDGG